MGGYVDPFAHRVRMPRSAGEEEPSDDFPMGDEELATDDGSQGWEEIVRVIEPDRDGQAPTGG